MTRPRIVLQPRRARPFYGRHPWVYPGAIARVEGDPADGDVVDLLSHTGNFVARGLYNSRSKIRVRLYSWSPDVLLEHEFFRQQLEAALHLRAMLDLTGPARACRLVFSEADGLSGFTVDRYDRWLVVQFTSLAMAQRRDLLVELLVELLQPEGIYLRTERGIGKLEGLDVHDGLLWGAIPSEPIVIEEHGVRFQVNLVEGQKTGLYLDQRENHVAVARLAVGRRVLDAFCIPAASGCTRLAPVRAKCSAWTFPSMPWPLPRAMLALTDLRTSASSALACSSTWTLSSRPENALAWLFSIPPNSREPVTQWRKPCAATGGCKPREFACSNQMAYSSLAVAPV